MSMFILAISCLTTSNLPRFMHLTFQVPMQYCSLHPQTLLPSPVTSTTGHCVCFEDRGLIISLVCCLGCVFPLVTQSRRGDCFSDHAQGFPLLSHFPLPAAPRNPSRSAHIPPPLGRLPYTWALLWIFSSPDCLWCLQLECLICPLSITHLMSLNEWMSHLFFIHKPSDVPRIQEFPLLIENSKT